MKILHTSDWHLGKRLEGFSRMEEQIEVLEEIYNISQKENVDAVIIAGDFNASPYSPVFKKLLTTSGLRDTRTGFGWLPSWPALFPLAFIPIDHILVSPDIQVQNRATGPYIGSDHYPVIAELSIN